MCIDNDPWLKDWVDKRSIDRK